MSQVLLGHSHMMESHMVMSHDKLHDGYGKVAHRPYNSCISSVQKIMETLSSSSCQLR